MVGIRMVVCRVNEHPLSADHHHMYPASWVELLSPLKERACMKWIQQSLEFSQVYWPILPIIGLLGLLGLQHCASDHLYIYIYVRGGSRFRNQEI